MNSIFAKLCRIEGNKSCGVESNPGYLWARDFFMDYDELSAQIRLDSSTKANINDKL